MSHPTGAVKKMGRGMVERHGDRRGRALNEPAFTLRASAGGTEPGGFVWQNDDGTTRKMTIEEASVLQAYPVANEDRNPMGEIVALDLFAGTGWGVACKRLGIEERGVELMAEAVATRAANGMETTYHDVWDGILLSKEMHDLLYGIYTMLIGSPPCQTFSMAGNGSGRKALNEVIEAIQLHAYKDPQRLLEFGEKHDMRTALVLTPLAYVYRDRPTYVALEQVPTVLPVWEACAEVMREMGYSVKTAVLHAEQYGVPQTRRRAILVARLDGEEVQLPTPTHSRYYSADPAKRDPGVLPWVSMAEALGWDKDGVTFTQNNRQAHQSVRTLDKPAPTVTAGHDSGNRGFTDGDAFTIASPEQVAALQSYPTTLRSNYGTGGDPAKRGERTVGQPAPTLTSKADRNKWDDGQAMTEEQASRLQTHPSWGFTNRPALTVSNSVGRGLAGGSGARSMIKEALDAGTFTRSPHRADDSLSESSKITVPEAGVLQTYERPFTWCGTKTKVFLQIGNAVPPLLAEHVLRALTAEPDLI